MVNGTQKVFFGGKRLFWYHSSDHFFSTFFVPCNAGRSFVMKTSFFVSFVIFCSFVSSLALGQEEDKCYEGEPCCEEGVLCGKKITTVIVPSDEANTRLIESQEGLKGAVEELKDRLENFEPVVKVEVTPQEPVYQTSSPPDHGGWSFITQLVLATSLWSYAQETPFYLTLEAGSRWLSRDPSMYGGFQGKAGGGIWTAEGTAVPLTTASVDFVFGVGEVITFAGIKMRAAKSPYEGDGWYLFNSVEFGAELGLGNGVFLSFTGEFPTKTTLKRFNGATFDLGVGVNIPLPF
jgi:hypothetical protein